MRGITNPRGTMHIHTHIACRSDQGLACMYAHSYAQGLVMQPRMRGKCALRVGGTLHCIERTGERDKEGVALCIDFAPVPFLNRCAQNLMMLCQHHCILITQLVKQIS